MPDAPLDPGWLDRLAHDLRGPLAPLQAAAQILALPDLSDANRAELAGIITRQTDVLSGMIDELGDWLSIQRGRLLRPSDVVEMDYVLRNAAMKLGSEPQSRIAFETTQGARIHADARRLTQAFATVLQHRLALQTSAPLPVACTIAGTRVYVTLGSALPEEVASTLVFDQVVPSADALGLALPIAAAIISAHGGSVLWEAAGAARTLRCELPLAKNAEQG